MSATTLKKNNNAPSTFLRNRSGGFALYFAICIIPLIAAAGLAVDYTNASRARAELQQAGDAAALAAAQATTMTIAQRTALARKFFDSNGDQYTLKDFGVVINSNGATVSASVHLKNNLMTVLGQDFTDIAIKSTAASKTSTLEIVFALDVSGSMLANLGGGKTRIQALKDATTQLVDKLVATTDFKVKVGYVPFTMNVNLGTKNIAMVRDTTNPLFGTSAWKGCVFERTAPDHVMDSPGGKWYAYVWPPMPDQWGSGDEQNNPSNGTNTDYQTNDEAAQASKDPAVLVNGPNYNCTRNEIMPLNTDLSAVKTGINALNAVYNQGTIIAPGVTWGMRLLSPAAPFQEGDPYSSSVKKILFVVTDGEQVTEAEGTSDGAYNQSTNSMTRWTFNPAAHGLTGPKIDTGFGPMDNLSPYGFIRDSRPFGGTVSNWDEHKDQLVALSDAACNEVKSNVGGRDITIYSMGVSNATAPGSRAYTALRNCATEPKNHFYVNDTASMNAAFDEILKRLASLRLTN
jgi:Flp pilus assembly protein TadG